MTSLAKRFPFKKKKMAEGKLFYRLACLMFFFYMLMMKGRPKKRKTFIYEWKVFWAKRWSPKISIYIQSIQISHQWARSFTKKFSRKFTANFAWQPRFFAVSRFSNLKIENCVGEFAGCFFCFFFLVVRKT